MYKKRKLNPEVLRQTDHTVFRWLGKCMIDTFEMEMETGDYSPKEALYHAKEQAIEELNGEYELTRKISEEELDKRLEGIFEYCCTL